MSTSQKVNKDLQKEREKCTFIITELTNYIDGGEDKTLDRRKKGKCIIHDIVCLLLRYRLCYLKLCSKVTKKHRHCDNKQ